MSPQLFVFCVEYAHGHVLVLTRSERILSKQSVLVGWCVSCRVWRRCSGALNCTARHDTHTHARTNQYALLGQDPFTRLQACRIVAPTFRDVPKRRYLTNLRCIITQKTEEFKILSDDVRRTQMFVCVLHYGLVLGNARYYITLNS